MRDFARLYAAIDETNKTNEKVAAMAAYFQTADPADAAWAVHFLIGRRPKRLINTPKMSSWAIEAADLPEWLFWECYDAVGDLAEAIAGVLHDPKDKSPLSEQISLAWWVENRLLVLAVLDEETQRESLLESWAALDRQGRFVFNKLITGAFRVGVSQDLVVRALSKASGVPAATIAHRLMGDWQPSPAFFQSVLSEDTTDTDISRPYPFCLAHPLEGEPSSLGEIREWHAEWKWDGIRAQLIRRGRRSFVWSRGEDLITERFPEIAEVCDSLPEGTVLDGEILAWAGGKPMKFLELQKRIGRKVLSKKILEEVPVVLVAFDLIESRGVDWRERTFADRRTELERIIDEVNARAQLDQQPGLEADAGLAVDSSDDEEHSGVLRAYSRLLMARTVEAQSWEELAEKRQGSRDLNVEGLMLKRHDSPYVVGRRKGIWWKWKIEPYTVDAVLIYANRGSGKRASMYTDYTFAVWNEGKLVPFAKAYSGLTDEEIRRVDSWVRRNTIEKFGPVRTVKPELVMELAFEGIQLSSRHKSGVAVRFPRIARWRHDKKPEQADSLDSVKAMLEASH
jgi:DNA ligase-1